MTNHAGELEGIDDIYDDGDWVAAINQLIGEPEVKELKIVRFKKRGNIKGLAKHLAKKYGPNDKGFFTRCMSAEEVAGYPEENRKAICARAHKEQIGVWPAESPDVKAKHKAKKEHRRIRIRRKCCD